MNKKTWQQMEFIKKDEKYTVLEREKLSRLIYAINHPDSFSVKYDFEELTKLKTIIEKGELCLFSDKNQIVFNISFLLKKDEFLWKKIRVYENRELENYFDSLPEKKTKGDISLLDLED